MNRGYVKLCVTGKNPRFFIKRFVMNKIKFDMYKEVNHGKIIFRTSYDDYLLLKDKTRVYEINIIKYYGPIKYVCFIKDNFSFVICFILSLIFLILMSGICFDLKVIHNDSKIRSLVKEELYSNGIKKFSFIPKFSKRKKIIDKIIKDNKEKIEWLEIERLGSKLIVKVTERKVNKKEEIIQNRHIVARKNGIIKKIEASNGVIVKKKNDYVTKGEIIISGDIIKDETVKGQVVSKGSVYAETWYNVKVEYPLYYEETKYLDEMKYNYIINFLSKSMSLKKDYTTSYLEKKKVLIKDRIFPFEISMEKQRKTRVTKEELTSDEAIKKALVVAENKIKSSLDDDEYIISKKTLNFTTNNSKIEVDVFFKVYENITDYLNTDPSLLDQPINTE